MLGSLSKPGTLAKLNALYPTSTVKVAEGKGWASRDNDGWPDMYIANDTVRNFLYLR